MCWNYFYLLIILALGFFLRTEWYALLMIKIGDEKMTTASTKVGEIPCSKNDEREAENSGFNGAEIVSVTASEQVPQKVTVDQVNKDFIGDWVMSGLRDRQGAEQSLDIKCDLSILELGRKSEEDDDNDEPAVAAAEASARLETDPTQRECSFNFYADGMLNKKIKGLLNVEGNEEEVYLNIGFPSKLGGTDPTHVCRIVEFLSRKPKIINFSKNKMELESQNEVLRFEKPELVYSEEALKGFNSPVIIDKSVIDELIKHEWRILQVGDQAPSVGANFEFVFHEVEHVQEKKNTSKLKKLFKPDNVKLDDEFHLSNTFKYIERDRNQRSKCTNLKSDENKTSLVDNCTISPAWLEIVNLSEMDEQLKSIVESTILNCQIVKLDGNELILKGNNDNLHIVCKKK